MHNDGFSLNFSLHDAAGGKCFIKVLTPRLNIFSQAKECIVEAMCSMMTSPQNGAKGPRIAGRSGRTASSIDWWRSLLVADRLRIVRLDVPGDKFRR